MKSSKINKPLPSSISLRSSAPSSLDSYKHNRNRFCGYWSLSGPVDERDHSVIAYKRLNCKSWTCGFCGPRKANKLREAITKKAIKYDLRRFLTLTLDPKLIPEGEDAIKHLRQTWAKFRVYVKREFGESITYISVLEFHKSGVPHLHVMVDRYIPQKWISDAWSALGGGKIVYIKRVADLHRMGRYLSKYLTKEMILSAPSGTRRWTTSRDIRLFERIKSTGWRLIKVGLDFLYLVSLKFIMHEEYDEAGILCLFTLDKEFIPL